MLSELFEGYESAYLTCLDSDRETVGVGSPDFKRDVQFAKVKVDRLAGGVVMPGKEFIRLATTNGLFNELGEVWFSSRTFAVPYDPDLYGLPWDTETAKEQSALVSWMKGASVTVGLRDGLGFEYITADPEVAATLDTVSVRTPEAMVRYHRRAAG